MEFIKSIFPDCEIRYLKDEEYYYHVTLHCENISFDNYLGNKLKFKIYENKYIMLYFLMKCNKYQGNDVLEAIEKLGIYFNVEYVNLIDESNIIFDECKVSLSMVYILQNGYSWYNSKGYLSDNYEEEIINNKIFISGEILKYIETHFSEYYNYELEKLDNSFINLNGNFDYLGEKIKMEKYFNLKYSNFMDVFQSIFKNLKLTKKITISDFTKKLMEYIKTNKKECKDKEIIFLNKFIKMIDFDKKIKYDNQLFYKIDND